MIHNIDTSVKPIIGNKEIEKVYDLRYSLSHLPFHPMKVEDISANINSPKIESHLSDVYAAIASNNPHEKMHALTYFETMIINSNVAN